MKQQKITKHGFVAKMALEKSFGFFQHQLWTLPGRMMKSLFWSYALRRSGSDKTWRATRRVLGNKPKAPGTNLENLLPH